MALAPAAAAGNTRTAVGKNRNEGKKMTELEIMQRAKMYMDKLAQGIDPISDQ